MGKLISLDSILERISNVSTLPDIAIRIMEVANSPRTSAADLKEVVESDPAFAARILKIVNSVAYAPRSRVTDIQRAISMLGFNEVKNLALTASVADIFKHDIPIASYNRRGLWKHMVCTGLTARLVMARTGNARFDEAFLAGLLHDLGIVLMDQFAHEPFVNIMTAPDKQKVLIEAEKGEVGFNHGQLGARLGEAWKFPRSALLAMRYHHASHLCTDEENRLIVQAVEVGNFICTRRKLDSTSGYVVTQPKVESFQEVMLDRQGLQVLLQDLDEELTKADTLINI